MQIKVWSLSIYLYIVWSVVVLLVKILSCLREIIIIFLFFLFFFRLICQGKLDYLVPTSTPVHSNVNGCSTVPNGFGFIEHEREMEPATEARSIELLAEQLVPGTGDHSVIPLCQRLIAALISEEDCSNGIEDLKFSAYEMDGDLESNSLNYQSLINFQFAGPTAFNGYRITGKMEHDEPESDMVGFLSTGMNSNFGHSPNGLHSDQTLMPSLGCSEYQYDNMHINEKLLLEIQSLSIFPEPVVSSLLPALYY